MDHHFPGPWGALVNISDTDRKFKGFTPALVCVLGVLILSCWGLPISNWMEEGRRLISHGIRGIDIEKDLEEDTVL